MNVRVHHHHVHVDQYVRIPQVHIIAHVHQVLTLDIIVTVKMNARNILHHVRVVPDAKTIGLALTVSAKTGSMEIVSLAVTSMNVQSLWWLNLTSHKLD